MAVTIPEETQIPHRPTKQGKIYTSRLDAPIETTTPDLDTLSKNFLHNVHRLGDEVAMRKKRYGIWIEYSWNQVYEHVSDFCLGLISLGLEPEDSVTIIGENDPEFYWSQIAVHAARAMTCGVFSDATPAELQYVLTWLDSKFLIAHDQEQVDKALAIREQVPSVRKVIYWEDKGLWGYDDEWLASFDEIEELGREYKRQHSDRFPALVAETKPEDVIILSMTSGTTSLPKFVMVTNQQLVVGDKINKNYVPVNDQDNWLSFSPLAWATENAFGFTPHMIHGMKVNFQEGPETTQTDLREIAPVGLLFSSRIWEGLASSVMFRINDSSWINRSLYKLFMPVAYKIADLEDRREPVSFFLRIARSLGEIAVFQPLRDKIGLTRAINALTAGSALSPDVVRFFRAIGVELRQLYACTESYGTLHIPGDVKLGSVGVVIPGIEIKLADDQEILIRTVAQFSGYYKAPDKTGEAIDEEGWYHTGDAGYFDDDEHLIYLDRVSDMIQLKSGESFSPQYIEGRLKFSPYIQDVMSIGGDELEYVTAIIIIDFENVARWAEKRGISFTTFVDLSQKPEVYALIQEDVERVNASLPEAGRVRKFVILHKEFDADEAELTRTRKLRRGALTEKYHEILEALYNDRESVAVSAEVKYRDGRTGVVQTALNICSLTD